jgi:hypothetical protein
MFFYLANRASQLHYTGHSGSRNGALPVVSGFERLLCKNGQAEEAALGQKPAKPPHFIGVNHDELWPKACGLSASDEPDGWRQSPGGKRLDSNTCLT